MIQTCAKAFFISFYWGISLNSSVSLYFMCMCSLILEVNRRLPTNNHSRLGIRRICFLNCIFLNYLRPPNETINPIQFGLYPIPQSNQIRILLRIDKRLRLRNNRFRLSRRRRCPKWPHRLSHQRQYRRHNLPTRLLKPHHTLTIKWYFL